MAEDTLFNAASPFPLSKQSNFSCLFPVVSEPLFLCGASPGPVVNGACFGISSSSCQLRTKNHFPLAFRNISTSLYAVELLHVCCFATVSFGVNYTVVEFEQENSEEN